MHSKFYRFPEDFNSKKVLVIGGGPSGVEVANSLQFKTNKVLLSTNKNTIFLPKMAYGLPFDYHNIRYRLPWTEGKGPKFHQTVKQKQDAYFESQGTFYYYFDF